MRLDIDKLLSDNGVANQAHILKPELGKFIGYQSHIDIRKTALPITNVGAEQNDLA